MIETVYLVKFDCGYYAAKQKNYQWSFTDNPYLAQAYKTLDKAKERGEWGIGLVTDPLKTYVIEKYQTKYVMELSE